MKHYVTMMTVALVLLNACKKENTRMIDNSYQPDMDLAHFTNSTEITNIYMPFETDKKYIFETERKEGLQRTEIQRLNTTKTILGIPCITVHDKVWLNEIIIEDTFDWFAQDNDGNLWYMGETVDNYNTDGSFKDREGSWEAGVDDAKAGIIMPAAPAVGMTYRLEYYFEESEDQAEIIAVNVIVDTPYSTFRNCIQTREWSELEPEANEIKYYAAGIGLVKVVNIVDNEVENLVDIEE